MKNLLFLLLFITSITTSFAQFGIRATYGAMTASDWENAISEQINYTDTRFNSIGLGLDYWFRLKNQRIEFMPTLQYTSYDAEVLYNVDGTSRIFDIQSVGFRLNTHIYFLDFKGDCDCPTWSKSEPWVEKGLFAFISPGIDYQTFEYTADNGMDGGVILETKNSDLNLNVGAGLGLDIGLSDLVTITPYAGLRFHNKAEWRGFLSDFTAVDDVTSNMWRLYGGIRLGVRFDD